jgi:dihydroneopterin aldolase
VVTIHLHEIIIFARHGIYEQEKISGNSFEVNLDVSFTEKKKSFDSMGDTIDYEKLNQIVHECMEVASPLIEKVCKSVIDQVKHHYPRAREIKISIFKLQPPIENFRGQAGVSMRKKW